MLLDVASYFQLTEFNYLKGKELLNEISYICFCLSSFEEKKPSAHCILHTKVCGCFFSLHNLINRKKYKIVPYNYITNKKIKQIIHEILNNTPSIIVLSLGCFVLRIVVITRRCRP